MLTVSKAVGTLAPTNLIPTVPRQDDTELKSKVSITQNLAREPGSPGLSGAGERSPPQPLRPRGASGRARRPQRRCPRLAGSAAAPNRDPRP